MPLHQAWAGERAPAVPRCQVVALVVALRVVQPLVPDSASSANPTWAKARVAWRGMEPVFARVRVAVAMASAGAPRVVRSKWNPARGATARPGQRTVKAVSGVSAVRPTGSVAAME